MVTIEDVRALALSLPRTTEALVRDRVDQLPHFLGIEPAQPRLDPVVPRRVADVRAETGGGRVRGGIVARHGDRRPLPSKASSRSRVQGGRGPEAPPFSHPRFCQMVEPPRQTSLLARRGQSGVAVGLLIERCAERCSIRVHPLRLWPAARRRRECDLDEVAPAARRTRKRPPPGGSRLPPGAPTPVERSGRRAPSTTRRRRGRPLRSSPTPCPGTSPPGPGAEARRDLASPGTARVLD